MNCFVNKNLIYSELKISPWPNFNFDFFSTPVYSLVSFYACSNDLFYLYVHVNNMLAFNQNKRI